MPIMRISWHLASAREIMYEASLNSCKEKAAFDKLQNKQNKPTNQQTTQTTQTNQIKQTNKTN